MPAFEQKPLEEITAEDLLALVDNEVSEGPRLDFKSQRLSPKQLLKAVTALANTDGGHLLFGVEEEEGVATAVPGIGVPDSDKEVLGLEQQIRDGADPHVQGLSTQVVRLANENAVIVVRIDRSWAAPHRVTIGGTSRFYKRGSRGVYELTTAQIRREMVMSSTVLDKVRDLRSHRVRAIEGGGGQLEIEGGRALIVHVVPLEAMSDEQAYSLSTVADQLRLIGGQLPKETRYNLEGLLGFDRPQGASACLGYLQVFRSGVFEYADILQPNEDKLYPAHVETRSLRAILARLRAPFPIIALVSLVGVNGLRLDPPEFRFGRDHIRHGIDRARVELPGILLEHEQVDLPAMMRPAFDTFWNAAGWPRSGYYDQEGRYTQDW